VEAPEVATAGGAGAGRMGGPGAGGGGPGAGGPPNPQMMVDRIFAADTDGDGKISSEEMSGLDDRMRERAAEYDANSDGFLEKAEVLQAIQKRMKERAASGGT